MSEKVLGFYAVGGKAGKKKVIVKKPVRLASESVDLKWLEKWCKEHQHRHIDRFLDKLPPSVFTRGLLKAVRLQAEKEAKKK